MVKWVRELGLEKWLPWGAAGEKNRPKRQIPRFKPKSLAFRIVIYMKRLGYLERVGLNRREKCRWAVKTGGFSREI